MCIEDEDDEDVPVTSGWMAVDEQKAAEANNWEVLVGVSAEALAKKSGLDFENSVQSFKMMNVAKKWICNEDSILVTSGWMTTDDEQRAAEANNWETIEEVSAADLAKKSGLSFENSVPSFKLMYVAK